jgi:uncharacterized protein (UPF0335 family)
MVKKSDNPNTISEEKIEPYIRKIESFLVELASERGAYMARCRALKDAIKEVYEESSADGISRPAFKKAVDTFQLQRKINAIRSELEADTLEVYDQIVTAVEGLDDLPLGQAALERETRELNAKKAAAGGKKKASAAVEALAGEAASETAH